MTSNEQLQDLLLERSLLIERVKGGMSLKIAQIYADILAYLEKKITENTITMSKANQLISDIKKNLNFPYADFGNDLISLAQDENDSIVKALNDSAGINIASGLANAKVIEKIANTSLIQGATIKDWFSSLNASLQFDVEREIRLGVTNGENTSDIRQRLQNTLKISNKNADSIILTAIGTITNDVREQVYKENEDIFKGYVFVATLDSRTTQGCALRDGLQYDLKHNPIGHKIPYEKTPRHFRCRSLYLPILKSWKDLGLDIEIPKGTRASMDGQVPQDVNFADWFDSKGKDFQMNYLGINKYELYKSNKLNFTDLFDTKGNPLTVSELRSKYK